METDARRDRQIELFDGTHALLRAIRPEDADALVRFHAHLTPATVYRRFFGYHLVLSAGEVERFTHVDGTNRLALVVSTDSDLLAVGRYDRLGDSPTAEVAFVVADAYQHHGLGSRLLERLADEARKVGIQTFTAETIADNRAMLSVFRDSGYPSRTTFSGGVVEVTLDIRVGVAHPPRTGTDQTSRVPRVQGPR